MRRTSFPIGFALLFYNNVNDDDDDDDNRRDNNIIFIDVSPTQEDNGMVRRCGFWTN